MKLIATALIAAGMLTAAPAMANMDLAKKSNCMSCHTVDKKLVGPSYQDVAKKYAERILGFNKGQLVFDDKPGNLGKSTIQEIYGAEAGELIFN